MSTQLIKPNYLETRVNLPIWNNHSEKARSADIKLQKAQNSPIVVSVVNNFFTAPEMPPKDKVVDGELLLVIANLTFVAAEKRFDQNPCQIQIPLHIFQFNFFSMN